MFYSGDATQKIFASLTAAALPGHSVAEFNLAFSLSFFLGWRKPNLITGLSGRSAAAEGS